MSSGSKGKVELGRASELQATETNAKIKVKAKEITGRRIDPAMQPNLYLLTELRFTVIVYCGQSDPRCA